MERKERGMGRRREGLLMLERGEEGRKMNKKGKGIRGRVRERMEEEEEEESRLWRRRKGMERKR